MHKKGIEWLDFRGNGNFLGYGNSGNNILYSLSGDDVLFACDGDDYVDGYTGADRLFGGSGNDTLSSDDGRASLYGGSGDDELAGGEDGDYLYGGHGCDTFRYSGHWESTPTQRDVIKAEAGAAAFDGAGRARGDLIDLTFVDTDLMDNPYSGWKAFVFGSNRKGGLTVVDVGTDSLVRGNLDDDGGFEFQILIEDGAVRASAYTADDFILAFA